MKELFNSSDLQTALITLISDWKIRDPPFSLTQEHSMENKLAYSLKYSIFNAIVGFGGNASNFCSSRAPSFGLGFMKFDGQPIILTFSIPYVDNKSAVNTPLHQLAILFLSERLGIECFLYEDWDILYQDLLGRRDQPQESEVRRSLQEKISSQDPTFRISDSLPDKQSNHNIQSIFCLE
jgi:hypothetical protein